MRLGHPMNLAVVVACTAALFATDVAGRDAAPVDINTASVKDLQELPGVGEATAKKIVAGRPYSSVDDLAKAGVSKSTISKMRPLVTTGGAAPSSSPASAGSAKTSSSPAAKGPSGPIDLNSASLKDLEELPGVGEATAKKIVAGRPYASVDDLAKAGVSKGTIEKLRSAATVSASGAPRAAAASAPAPAAASKSGAAPTTKAAGALVDLNTASLKELEELPGVGEATAKKIVTGRPYASVDDLTKAGVSKSTIEKLRSGATVSGTPAARPAASSAPSTPPAAPASVPAAPPAAAQQPPAPPTPSAASASTKTAAPPAASGTKEKLAPGQKVNINTATKEELMLLPGIGPTKAQAIIDGRPFATPEDIMKVKGIKEGTFGKLKDDIVVH
jgi:competence protein ComEA